MFKYVYIHDHLKCYVNTFKCTNQLKQTKLKKGLNKYFAYTFNIAKVNSLVSVP